MAWLKEQKIKIDQEELAKRIKQEEADRKYKEEFQFMHRELLDFCKSHFDEKHEFKIEINHKYNYAKIYHKDLELVSLRFYYEPIMEWDSDGCSWPTEDTTECKQMKFLQPYKNEYGSNKADTMYRYLNEKDLAQYLLQYVKI